MSTETRTTTRQKVLTRGDLVRVLPHVDLTPDEEIVVRMRYGIGLDPATALSYRGKGHEELEARLALMEKAILDELEERFADLPDASLADKIEDF